MSNDQIVDTDLDYGNLSLVSDHDNVTMKRYWMRGEWWDYLHEFWDDLLDDGLLNDPRIMKMVNGWPPGRSVWWVGWSRAKACSSVLY